MTRKNKPRRDALVIAQQLRADAIAKQTKKATKEIEQIIATAQKGEKPGNLPLEKKTRVSPKTGRKVTVTTKGKKKSKKRSAYKQKIYDAIRLDKQLNKKEYAEQVKQLREENKAYADKCKADKAAYINNNPQNFYTPRQGMKFLDTKPKCLALLEAARKIDGKLHCVYCNHDTVYRNHARQNFTCASCDRQFVITAGTFLHKSKVDIRYVFEIIMEEICSTTGIKISEVLKICEYSITYPTAVKLLHKIRSSAFTQRLFKIVEDSRASADTTSISGRDVNRHDKDKKGLKKLYKEAMHFLTIKQERGDTIVERVADLSTGAMRWGLKNVPLSCELTTDGHRSFGYLKKAGYVHHTVNHSMGENARGRISSNGAESVHAMIKVALSSHFNTIKPVNLQAFINSVVFTKNTKHKLTFEQQFELALKGIVMTAKTVKTKVVTIAAKEATNVKQYTQKPLTKVAVKKVA